MRVVAIGGGHGAAATLRSALLYAEEVAGIISVADDGGSSGRLARDLGVLPMGDIRNCLAALAPPSPTVEVFQHRFSGGPMDGHVVGNLMLAAVTQESGSFMTAIAYASELLGSTGRIVPPTLETVRLVSEVEGQTVKGQVALATSSGRVTFVRLDPPKPKALPEALDLLAEADQIVLGPGSLFTSVLPPLLVPDVREAFVQSRGRKIYVCNVAAPPGETGGLDAAGHLAAVFAHLGPDAVDVVIVHTGRTPERGVVPVNVDESALRAMGVEIAADDLIPASGAPRHDSDRLAEVLRAL